MKDYFVKIKFPNSNDFFVSQVKLDLPSSDLSVDRLSADGLIDTIKSSAIEFRKGYTAQDFEILEVKAIDDYVPYNLNVVTPDGFEHTLFNIQFDTAKDPEAHRREILQSIVEGTNWTIEQLRVKYFGPAPQHQFVETPSVFPTIAEQIALAEHQAEGLNSSAATEILRRYSNNVQIDYDIVELAKSILDAEQNSLE